jgi:hypothetical protein
VSPGYLSIHFTRITNRSPFFETGTSFTSFSGSLYSLRVHLRLLFSFFPTNPYEGFVDVSLLLNNFNSVAFFKILFEHNTIIFDEKLYYPTIRFSAVLYAQNSVSGTVTNMTNQPVSGVSVYAPELHKGTTTDENGKFSLTNLPNGTVKLSFTS